MYIKSNKSKKGGKNQVSIQSSTTPDPGYHMGSDKTQLNITNKSQEVSPFPSRGPQGSNEQTQKHEKHKT